MNDIKTNPIVPIVPTKTTNIDLDLKEQIAKSLQLAADSIVSEKSEKKNDEPKQGDRLQSYFLLTFKASAPEETEDDSEGETDDDSEEDSNDSSSQITPDGENSKSVSSTSKNESNDSQSILPSSSDSTPVRVTSEEVVAEEGDTPEPNTEEEEGEQETDDTVEDDIKIVALPLILSSIRGDILGDPVFVSSTRSHSHAVAVINDPDGSILKELKQYTNMKVEVGISDIFSQSAELVIFEYGRHLPIGTYVMGVDKAAIAQSSSSGVSSNNSGVQTEKSELSEAIVDFYSESNDLLVGAAESIAQGLQSAIIQDGLVVNPNAPSSRVSIKALHRQQRKLKQELSEAAQGGQRRIKEIEQVTKLESPDGVGLTVQDRTGVDLEEEGRIKIAQSTIGKAIAEAAKIGASAVVEGSKVILVGNDNLPTSGVVLDYVGGREAFLGNPRIIRPTPVRLSSASGSITVRGYDPRTESTVEATVVTPSPLSAHPTGIIKIPNWKEIKLADPIFTGSPYTWANATSNGSRVPPNKTIIENIIKIATIITKLTRKTVGRSGKWRIVSWYRPPDINKAEGGHPDSYHIQGLAVDVDFPGKEKLFQELKESYQGGLALASNYLHIDAGPKRRWKY